MKIVGLIMRVESIVTSESKLRYLLVNDIGGTPIGDIKGLEKENDLAKSIIKAINNIFSKEKGIIR